MPKGARVLNGFRSAFETERRAELHSTKRKCHIGLAQYPDWPDQCADRRSGRTGREKSIPLGGFLVGIAVLISAAQLARWQMGMTVEGGRDRVVDRPIRGSSSAAGSGTNE